ncbi:MAG: DUF6326 family protein [Chromatiales bacterium]|nr:DUF6326 family protein [Chromatiales bacterium]
MNTDASEVLEDPIINIKIKLAGLWASVMFIFIYVDYFGLYVPGFMQKIIGGEVGHTGIEISQIFLLSVTLLMIIPSLMIGLSLILQAKANRLTNIVAAVFKIVVIVGAMIDESWAYYLFASFVELAILSLIIWYAWTWPRQAA